ncbi:MAG: rRNA maturation RNase YbeY [Candidatus Omnitrophica bacterium]|nr:rRNA maturation RNase YbeY [Candidatus Omnitrophota bacterium]
MRIIITDDQKRIRLNPRRIKSVCSRIKKALRIPQKNAFAVSFLSKADIKALNRKYFKKNRATDVIAFECRGSASRGLKAPYEDYLGDIIICPEVVFDNSKLYDNDFFAELTLCIIHGVLHLSGYKDITKKDRLRMQRRERQVLGRLE